MDTRRPMVVGNWKMNGDREANGRLLAGLRASIDRSLAVTVEIAVCPPYPYIAQVADAVANAGIGVGAQDVASFAVGAYTGEVSARMLLDSGCGCVIVGHSERRTLMGETDALVASKAAIAMQAGLQAIVCVGETLEERESGQAESVLARQIDALAPLVGLPVERLVIAYEPVWAIGTGKTATVEQAQSAHRFIRTRLAEAGFTAPEGVRVLYGGSVKPGNAAALFAQDDIDGGLIGGAALVADEFAAICRAAGSL
jgi:triosephosphate isomerase